jgi:EpsI family protein
MLTRATVLFGVFLATAGVIARQNRPEQIPPRQQFERFPLIFSAWTGEDLPKMDSRVLAVLGVDDYMSRAYFGGDRSPIGLYVGYYKSQRQGDSIHSPLNCLPGAGWQPLAQGYLTIPVSTSAREQSILVNRYVIQKGLDRQLVLYWYQSHGRVVASEYWSKFYLVRDALQLNRTDAALVRVVVPMMSNTDDAETNAEQKAADFVRALFPLLPSYLPS